MLICGEGSGMAEEYTYEEDGSEVQKIHLHVFGTKDMTCDSVLK